MSKLRDFVPPPFRRRNLERRLTDTFGRPFDRWRAIAGNRSRYIDAEGAPMEWVDWLLELFGYTDVRQLSERRRRNLLDDALDIWRDKWRAQGIITYLKALAGIPTQFEDVNIDAAFIAGVSLAGDIVGLGDLAYRFKIHRQQGVIEDEQLHRRLRIVLPAFSEYQVCDLDGEDCTDWMQP